MASQLHPDLARRVATRLARHGLGAGSLRLELPEQLLCAPCPHGSVLHQLRDAGVAISMDHFGRAGAALALCKTLPLDELKIDATFIDAIGDGGGSDMVAAIVLLARALSLSAVALGVLSEVQLATLAALGCRHYQGELFCAPLSADQLQQGLQAGWPADWRPAPPQTDPQADLPTAPKSRAAAPAWHGARDVEAHANTNAEQHRM